MTSVSPSSEHDHLRANSSPVRLPPVSMMPRDEFLQAPGGYNPTRRVSITDPFLHAYPAVSDPNAGQPDQQQHQSIPHPLQHPQQQSYNSPTQRRPSDEAQSGYNKLGLPAAASRPGSSGVTGGPGNGPPGTVVGQGDGQSSAMAPPHPQQSRYGAPPQGGQPSYEFSGPYPPGQGPPSFYHAPPPANYRFGGPSNGTPSSSLGPDHSSGPSYVDYSMRRHSLSGGNGQSPPRLPSIDASAPNMGLKRKTSLEDPIAEEGYPAPYPTGSSTYPSHLAYPSKRRGSSLTYDKVGNILPGGDSRRDSVISNSSMMNPAWDDDSRRGSGGSYSSATSQGYMSNYSLPTTVDSYDQRSSQSSQGYPAPYQRRSGDHYNFDQLQQQIPGQGPGPRGSFSVEVGPPPSHYPSSRGQPSSMLPSVAHSPPEEHHLSGPPRHSHSQSLPPAQAAWARAGPLPAHHSHPSSRNNSLDPTSAYGPGGAKLETPYSRSPELRVSHKLAERKRRKEMAQLFDELRDALPVDRGLKSSKWEILSKAVDYIISLKEHNSELARDNTMLRDHFGLGPGPQAGQGPSSQQQQQQGHQSPRPASHLTSPQSKNSPYASVSVSRSQQNDSSLRRSGSRPSDSWPPSQPPLATPSSNRDKETFSPDPSNLSPRATGLTRSANGSTPTDRPESEDDLPE